MSELRRVDLAPAWVLHRYPYRETSLIAELLSRDHGRIGVVVRGARGPARRGKPGLEPFALLAVSFRRRAELGSLVGVEPVGPRYAFGGAAFLAACYLNELVVRLLPRDDPAPDVYGLYSQALADLDSRREPAPAVRRFEGRLLRALGFAPPLDREGGGGALRSGTRYRYDPERGAVSVEQREDGLSAGLLAAIAAERYEDPAVLDAARSIYREIIACHLGGRRLKSLEVASAMAGSLQK